MGTYRPGSRIGTEVYLPGVDLVPLDVRDTQAWLDLISGRQIETVVHLAAASSVAQSWKNPEMTYAVNAQSVVDLLAGFDRLPTAPRFVFASSAEVFGGAPGPLTASAEHRPQNPYGESKSVAHRACVAARDAGYDTRVAVLFNHESALRPAAFVTRKIVRGAVEIALGQRQPLTLGNLEVQRDWGDARDHVRALEALASRADPADVVVATGQLHHLSDVVEAAFEVAGAGDPWRTIEHDPALVRTTDTAGTAGDICAARELLDWLPEHSFTDMIEEMVRIERLRVASGIEHDSAYLPVLP